VKGRLSLLVLVLLAVGCIYGYETKKEAQRKEWQEAQQK
jgi:DNA-binding PadR family transcriptional regulator